MTFAESQALTTLFDALTREGPHPAYHRGEIDRLARQWPTLYRALVQLADVRGVTLPPHGLQPESMAQRDDPVRTGNVWPELRL